MRKLLMIIGASVGLSAATIAAPTVAEARFDAGLAANSAVDALQVQYYGYGYRRNYYRPRYYAPRYYAPRYYAPPAYYAPRYRYY